MKKYKYDLFFPYYNGRLIQKEIKKFFPEDGSNQWIGQATKVDEFEEKFGKKFGFKHCLMTNSGTSALWLAYDMVGIKEDDEVIVTVLTCTATQMPLLHKKAKIVFADIEPNTLNIDPQDVEKKITNKTKAIVAVTLGGIPINNNLFKIAKKHNIPVIVDSAQSIGYNKGDYIMYSFQAIKQFTTCDGGMLVCKKKKDHERAKLLRWFGIDREQKQKDNWQAWQGRTMTFDIIEPGYKFQPTDLDALIGLIGLSEFDKLIKHRKKLVDIYKKELSGIDSISFLDDNGSTYWLMGIFVEDRDEFAKYMDDAGIGTNLVHLRNDIFKILGGKRQNLPNMNKVEPYYIYLPLHNRLKEDDIYKICQVIKSFKN